MLIRFTLSLAIGAALFAADRAGSRDHPLLTRYAGAEIIGYFEKTYEAYTLPLGRITVVSAPFGYAKSESVEGKLTRITYLVPKGRTATEVYRNYTLALAKLNAQKLFEGMDEGPLGMMGVRYDVLFSQVGQILEYSYAGQRFYAGRFTTPTAKVTLALYVIEYNDGLQPEGIVVAKGQVVVQLDIIESAIMDTGQVTAAEISTGLAKDGHIALYGILFDTNKAELKAESAAAVEQIAGVLKANATVKLYVVGHTDNVGAHEYNLELSRKRAESQWCGN